LLESLFKLNSIIHALYICFHQFSFWRTRLLSSYLILYLAQNFESNATIDSKSISCTGEINF